MIEVVKASRAQVPALAQVLARAFFDDPIATFVFRSEARRLEALNKFHSIEMSRMFLRYDETYTSSDLRGAAIWAPPQARRPGLSDLLRLASLGRYTLKNTISTIRALAAIESRHPREPHFYLAVLGTDPPHQGKGVASAILQPVLNRCDEEGIPAYLESSKERNVPFYMRHGFKVTEELTLPYGGPKIWLMWRQPQFSN